MDKVPAADAKKCADLFVSFARSINFLLICTGNSFLSGASNTFVLRELEFTIHCLC